MCPFISNKRVFRKSEVQIEVQILYLFFVYDKGKEDPNTTKSGPASAHQRSAI